MSTLPEFEDLLAGVRVIPVVVVHQVEHAVGLARALRAGGLTSVEVTMRTAAALPAIAALKREKIGLSIGAGTVLTADDVSAATIAGADFLVSPGSTSPLIAALRASSVPVLPGAATASEAMTLREQGFEALKFFPAEASGGVAMLRALAGPLPQLSFCPTGGVTPENARDYLELPNVFAIGGTWIAPEGLIASEDWPEIEQRARAASAL